MPNDKSRIQSYFVEDLFPCKRTSLLCGPSGAGKSRWLLPAIADWLEGKPILGKKSYPTTCAYISCDRPSDSTFELVERLNLKQRLKEMPIYSLMDRGRDFDFAKIPPMIGPNPRTLFIEAFQVLIPNGDINKYWPVMNFFRQWNQLCDVNDYSTYGSCHTPKMRDGEGYSAHRDKIMGTAAWGAATEGIVVIEYQDAADVDNSQRLMTVLPRNGKPWKLQWEFNDHGFLIPSQQEQLMTDFILTTELRKQSPGVFITSAEIVKWGTSKGLSRATVYRWIEGQKALRWVCQGRYAYEPLEQKDDSVQ